MKIFYCIAGTYNSGGMERVLANKANYLVEMGYDITILTTDQEGKCSYFEMNADIKHVDLGINYNTGKDKNMLSKTAAYIAKQRLHRKRLTAFLSEQKADIVVSMFDHEVSFLYKIKDGSKKILEIHFSRFKRLQYGRKGLWRQVDEYRSKKDLKWVQKYDRFIVLTHEDAGYWGKLMNMKVIPNANSFVSSKQSDCTNKRVIAVGRYDYQKGFEDLIAAWKRVYDKHPDWTLHIFGNGELRQAMQEQVDDLGLSKVIDLAMPVKNIEEEYVKSSFLAMSSRYEGLPMTLLEAQTCGLPMVAYTCKCGPLDIIEDGVNGYLVREGDRKQLTNRMLKIIENPDLRIEMGREAYRKSHFYAVDRVMKQWTELFNELVDKNN